MELNEIIEITEELVGDKAAQVAEYLYHNPGHSEFDIHEALGFPISTIRSILYELKAKNLIDYERRKDKIKGWYLYYWNIQVDNYERVYFLEKKKILEQFKERLQKEKDTIYYICPNYCKRMSFNEALENNFTCPVCNSLLIEEDKERKIEMLEKNIREYEEYLKKKEKELTKTE